MRRTLTVMGETFPLATPFRISRGVKTAAEVVTVTLAQGDVVGRGECVPYPRYGESVAASIAEIEAVRMAIETGVSRRGLLEILPAGAARNAVDCALWDLELGLAGSSLAEATGIETPLRPMATAMTVGLDTPERMGLAAAALADAPLIKVKVDADDPVARLRAVRAAAPGPRLIVDPNESWDEELLRAMQLPLVELGTDLVEQPVAADADAWLAGFTPAVPICADEAVHVADDLDRIAGRYQAVNIKLDKTGGLTAAIALADAAQARGLTLMTGCMISSSLSIAPALHIAGRCAFVDLDGPVWLREDRPGGVTDRHGIMLPPQPGFWGDGMTETDAANGIAT